MTLKECESSRKPGQKVAPFTYFLSTGLGLVLENTVNQGKNGGQK